MKVSALEELNTLMAEVARAKSRAQSFYRRKSMRFF